MSNVCKDNTVEDIAQSNAEAAVKAAKAKEVHRQVVDTIVCLIDSVDEQSLTDKLHLLDMESWDEVIEERFLARVCGLPLCSRQIVVENYMGKKYWIKKCERKIYTAIPKSEKFCSVACYERSCYIQSQLYDEPLWFNWDRPAKAYNLNTPASDYRSRPKTVDNLLVQETERLLVTRLHELKVAEHGDSDNDADEDDTAQLEKVENEKFLAEMQSFVSSVTAMSAAKKKSSSCSQPVSFKEKSSRFTSGAGTDSKPKNATVSKKVSLPSTPSESSQPKSTTKPIQKPRRLPRKPKDDDMTDEMTEKLARIRNKYGGRPDQVMKKPPILIEAPKLPK